MNCVKYEKSEVLEQLWGGEVLYSYLSLVQCDSNDRRLTCVANRLQQRAGCSKCFCCMQSVLG